MLTMFSKQMYKHICFLDSMDYTEASKCSSEQTQNSSLSSTNSSKNSYRSLDENSLFKLKNYQFFHRFRKYSSKLGNMTRSANNSPSLLSTITSPIHGKLQQCRNAYSPRYGAWNPVISSSNVKLIDICLIKRPSGFGLTLSGVIAFIPNGIFDINISPKSQDKQDGFFQRLLQIRCVSDDIITYDTDFVQTRAKNHSIRPGDVLLAAGGYRLAGCTPEYAVQLLSKIPVGGAIQVTLLRGLGIPANYSVAEEVNYTKHLYEPRSSSLCSSVNSSSEMSPNKTYSDLDYQIGSKFTKPYIKHFCTNCLNSLRTVNLIKKDNDYGFTYFYTNYGCLVNQVARNDFNQVTKSKLQPGDLIVKLGNFDLTRLTKSQFLQLLNAYLKSKSIQCTVIQVCSKCLKQVNQSNIHLNSEEPKTSYLNLSKTFLTPSIPTVTDVSKAEMISFLRSVLNSNYHGKQSTNHNLQVNNSKFNITNVSELNSVNNSSLNKTPAPWLPEQCITPGIGMSGPCETPDYIPVSQLINACKKNTCQNITCTHLNSKQGRDYQKSYLFKQNQQQPNANYVGCNDSIQHRISSPDLSSSVQVKSLHNPELNISDVNHNNDNPSSINHNLIETNVKIHYSSKGGKLKFVKENTEQNLPCILPVDTNADSDKSYQDLVVGDLLVAIENQSVLNCNPSEIEELLQSAAKNNKGLVTLTVRRILSSDKSECVKASDALTKDLNDLNIINVKLLKEKHEGFGFVIVSSLNNEKTSEIGRIIPGSPADRCGQLEVGQRILAINGYSLIGINHMDIVNLIRQNQQQLVLTIEKNGSLSGEQNDNHIDQLDTGKKHISPVFGSNTTRCSASTDGSKLSELVNENYVIKSSMNNTSTKNVYSIMLQRGPNGFGFSVRSGFNSTTSPLIVYRIIENGPAFQQGQMKVGDEILEINGISTLTMTHHQAVEMIRSSGSTIKILLQHFNENQHEDSF
ncbi:Membrane-associated guanylate kinase, WW and PDZ domain-containing protein 1 [Schistosoma japonicum]|nr:Membrane-associated guanylate kinase, WW and PDZ domain-containing protein 1 [Schistosoma japonicum]